MQQSTSGPATYTIPITAIPAASVNFSVTPPTYVPGSLFSGNVPTATSDTPAVATVAVDATGLNLILTLLAPGTANITVSGLGSSDSAAQGTFGLTVTGGPATTFFFVFGAPIPPAS